MKVDIKVPRMGESISEATIGTIFKQSGTGVQLDDEILELETDKVNQVLYAPKKGVLTLSVKEGDKVNIDATIGYIETEATAAATPPKEKEKEKTPEPAPKPAEEKKPPQPPKQTQESKSIRFTEEEFVKELKGTPSTKPAQTPKPSPKAPAPTSGERETRRRIPSIRQVIAKRLVKAQNESAMLTTFNEVDMSEVMHLRTTFQEEFTKKHGVKLGLMSFFVDAAVSALKAFPIVNSYLDGEEIVQRNYYDLGIAVSTDRGLLVPVIRDCDKHSMAEIEAQLVEFSQKAREGTIAIDDLQGGGFTITNGGTFGSLLSTPILNPPQVAILGMHKIQKRPIAMDDQVVIRPMMYLALSYDHRLVDGKEAVQFLVHIKNMIENPSRILLQV